MTAQETAADAPDPASSALAADDPAGGRLLTPTFVLIVLAGLAWLAVSRTAWRHAARLDSGSVDG